MDLIARKGLEFPGRTGVMALQGLGARQCVTRGGRHPYARLPQREENLIGARTRTEIASNRVSHQAGTKFLI
jgi:hypothetical protein